MLKTAQFVIGIIVISFIMLAVTVYSGTLTDRWGHSTVLLDSRKLIKELPKEINDWEAEGEDKPLDESSVTMLQLQDGYLVRSYRNKKTQAVIYMVLLVGSTGRVVVHTPEICFGGKDFQKEDTRISETIPWTAADGSETDDSFWKVYFINQGLRRDKIAFYYSVSIGGPWIATENPRFTFQSSRYAYKIQIQAVAEEDSETDTIKLFLQDCLPTIHEYLKPCN